MNLVCGVDLWISIDIVGGWYGYGYGYGYKYAVVIYRVADW